MFLNIHIYIIFTASRQGSRPTSPHAPVLGPITSTVKHLYCNFEIDLCGMTQDSIDDLDYLLHRGGTPSRDTGPAGDHTTGKGKVILGLLLFSAFH